MTQELSQEMKQAHEKLQQIKREVGRVIVGQSALIDALLIGMLTEGHLLLEGVPGVAKTLAANTFAKTLGCTFKRIQFTPDLLPADLVGTPIYNPKEGTFVIKKGPVFTQVLLADEINRAPAKVQSALLEIMQEKQVTLGGETHPAPTPFLVIATQNPIEQEGTYPLAEAQTDRFMMKVKILYPTKEEEKEILNKMGSLHPQTEVATVLDHASTASLKKAFDAIYIDEKIIDYLLNIVHATRNPEKYKISIQGLLEYGASPRASLALKQASKAQALLSGRAFVTPDDIKAVVHPILRHRLRLSYEAEAEALNADDLIDRILNQLPVP